MPSNSESKEITETRDPGHATASQEAAREFEAIFELPSICMAQAEPRTGRLLRVNQRLARLLGYSPSELIGVPFSDLTHADDRARDWEGFQRLVRGEVPDYEVQKRFIRKDGGCIWVSVAVNLVRDANGQPFRTVALIHDITERKKADEQVRRSQETFSGLIQNNPFGLYVVDADFRLLQVSLGARKVFSHVDPLLGRDFGEVLRCIWEEPFATTAIQRFRHTLESGEPFVSRNTVEQRHDTAELEAYDWRIERITLPDGRFGVVCYFYDLSERQRWEAELRHAKEAAERSRAETQAIVSSMAEGVVIFDAAGNVVNMNAAAIAIHGFDSIQAHNMQIIQPMYELRTVHGEVVPFEEWPVSKVLRGEKFTGYELRVRRTDGSREWIASHGGAPVYDSSGKLALVVITLRDVTIKREAQEEVRHRGEQFKMLLDQAPLGVFLVDAHFRLVEVNPVAFPAFNDIRDVIGRDLDEVMHTLWPKALADTIVSIFRRTLQTGEAYHEPEFAAMRADRGVPEYYDWHINRITLPDGSHGVACYFREISDQVRTRQAIAESEARYRTLFNSIDEGFCVIEMIFDEQNQPVDYRFIEVNPAFEKHTGLVNALGKRMKEMSPMHEQHWFEVYGKVALTGEAVRFESPAQSLNRWFDLYAFRIGSPEKRRVAVLFDDITERKRSAEALAEAQADLKEHATKLEKTVADRTAKLRETISELEHFSYTITHDLRAPLRSMQAFGELVRDEYQDKLDDAGRDYLRRITQAASRMDSLITDALNYTKAVQAELTLERIEPKSLLLGIIESYPHLQPPKAEIRVEGDFPAVLANKAGLTQCFSNYLGNAVKFIRPNNVARVRVWAEDRDRTVRFWVEDNGIGIPPEQHEQVFGMFQQLNTSYGGTGIGLALVRKVAERMKGSVGVEAELGHGSRFWLELVKA